MAQYLRSFRFLPRLGDALLNWIESTLLWEYAHPFPSLPSSPCFVVCWHSRLLMLPFLYPPERKAVALVSPSTDGDILSSFLLRKGRGVIRGSSRKGALTAVTEILKHLDRGYDVAVTLDGPIGPKQKAKPGIVHMAMKYKIPVFPLSYTAMDFLTLPTWDRMILPLPFSRALAQYHPLLHLTPEYTREQGVAIVENALNRLIQQGEAWRKGKPLREEVLL